MRPRSTSLALILLASCPAALGCGFGSDMPTADSGKDAGADVVQNPHALRVNVALSDDGAGINLGTQNGGEVHVPSGDVAGKTYFWITLPGGEIPGNADFLELGSGTIAADLTASYETSAIYADGPWEIAMFISVTGGPALNGPQAGDLAAFDNTPPAPGEPAVTGASIRMSVHGADVEVTLDNSYFVQY